MPTTVQLCTIHKAIQLNQLKSRHDYPTFPLFFGYSRQNIDCVRETCTVDLYVATGICIHCSPASPSLWIRLNQESHT